MRVVLFNTLGRTEMEFVPIEPGRVCLYTCGPTVYSYAHIGNLRTYVFEDVLRRMLTYVGNDVKHVMNITDVGHLTSDADIGEDKMSVASRREGRTVWEIARFYEEAFFRDLTALNIWRPGVTCRATEHIDDMIAFIQRLLERGYAYQAGGNVYFAVDRFPAYGELATLQPGKSPARSRVEPDEHKRNEADFVLWFTESKFPNQTMKWPSPWGVGFPGWHIECSAMATKYLGERIDIHCGGIDHIPVHHTNEIAQSEAALGHRWVNHWLHGEFLVLKEQKMSKSAGEFLTLAELVERGFSPIDYRYFCLGAHYRGPLQFSWDALTAARNALENLRTHYLGWLQAPSELNRDRASEYRDEFVASITHDLDTPRALARVWNMVRDGGLGTVQKQALLLDFDRVLGLGVETWGEQRLPDDLQGLLHRRERARKRGDYAEADALRAELLAVGVTVQDTPAGPKWFYVRKPGGSPSQDLGEVAGR